jgi:anti-sigma B factor antagonist
MAGGIGAGRAFGCRFVGVGVFLEGFLVPRRWRWHEGASLSGEAPGINEWDESPHRPRLPPFGPVARLRHMDLDVETGTVGSASVLTLRGEIDVYTAPRLRQAIIDLVDGGATNIVVDMEKIDFLDSTGLGVLVGGLKRVKAKDGSLSIVTTQDKILKIFDITGLNKVFAIHDSVESAVAPAP